MNLADVNIEELLKRVLDGTKDEDDDKALKKLSLLIGSFTICELSDLLEEYDYQSCGC